MHLACKRWLVTCPCTSTPSREGVWSSRRVAPHMINLGTGRSLDWVVGFVPRRFVQRQRAAVTRSIRHQLGSRADVDVLENSPAGNQNLFLGALAKFRKATISFVMFLRTPAGKHATLTGQIFMKISILLFFENLSRKFKLHSKPTRITGTLHEDQYTFMIISGSVLLRRNISAKSCSENQNTHFRFIKLFFENRAVCEIMWKKYFIACRPQMATAHAHCTLDK